MKYQTVGPEERARRQEIALANPPQDDYSPQINQTTQTVHEVAPPPEDDAIVAAIITVLLAGYAAKRTLFALTDILAPFGITQEAISAAFVLSKRGTVALPNAPRDIAPGIKLRGERTKEVAFRAAYIMNASKRIQADLSKHKPIKVALAEESLNYRRHESARKGRLSAAARVQESADRFGPLLGWYLNPLLNNEIECITANGHNFYADEGTLIGLPGAVHPNCGCKAGPPIAGAGLVNDAVSAIIRHVPAKRLVRLRSVS